MAVKAHLPTKQASKAEWVRREKRLRDGHAVSCREMVVRLGGRAPLPAKAGR